MDIRKRLFRKPLTTVLWLLFVTVMTGFLTVSVTLWLSSRRLAKTLNESHTAIAVRSDPGIDVHRQMNGGVTWTVDGRPFTTEDAAAMEAMDGVKAVRSHVLTGGSSPAFTPILDVRRELSWRAYGDIAPYYNAVFAGELVKMRTEEGSFYSSGIRNDANYLMLLFRLEDVLLLNDEFDEPMRNMQNAGGFIYKVDLSEDAAASYFTEGQRYVVSGTFEPMVTEYWDLRLNGEGSSRFPANYFVLDGGTLVRGNGYLESLSARNVVWSVEKGEFVYETVTGSVFPAAER